MLYYCAELDWPALLAVCLMLLPVGAWFAFVAAWLVIQCRLGSYSPIFANTWMSRGS
jgi:hypothetical protein